MADIIQQVECLKARANRNNKKERVAYVEAEKDKQEIYNDPIGCEQGEVDLDELKQAPPYHCKVIAPSNGKNPIELKKNDRFPKKTYTFNVTKCDEVFDLMASDVMFINGNGISPSL